MSEPDPPLHGPDDADSQLLFEGKHLHLLCRGTWEYVKRPLINGIVVLVALTDDDELVLIEQFRPPVQASVIELPAGLSGDIPGQHAETLADAARRELLEETGYDPGRLQPLVAGPPSPGASCELVTFYLATALRKVHAGGGDHTEDITVHAIKLDAVADWIEQARRERGVLVDPKVYAGLYFALTRRHPAAQKGSHEDIS